MTRLYVPCSLAMTVAARTRTEASGSYSARFSTAAQTRVVVSVDDPQRLEPLRSSILRRRHPSTGGCREAPFEADAMVEQGSCARSARSIADRSVRVGLGAAFLRAR